MIGGVGFVLGTMNPGALVAPGALASLIGLHWAGFDNWLATDRAASAPWSRSVFNQNGITYENVRSFRKLEPKLAARAAAGPRHAGS